MSRIQLLATLCICFISFVTPSPDNFHPKISVDKQEVVTISHPDYAVSCKSTPIYAHPNSDSVVIRFDALNTMYRIREASKNNEFVLVEIIGWVKVTDLICKG